MTEKDLDRKLAKRNKALKTIARRIRSNRKWIALELSTRNASSGTLEIEVAKGVPSRELEPRVIDMLRVLFPGYTFSVNGNGIRCAKLNTLNFTWRKANGRETE